MPVRSTETTHSSLQMMFLVTSAVSLLNVGTNRCLFQHLNLLLVSILSPVLVLETICCEILDLHTFLQE